MRESAEVRLELVHDVWTEFLADFENGQMLFDQILIINDSVYLRGPNLDLVQQYQAREQHIN
jgi:hypothetical protein